MVKEEELKAYFEKRARASSDVEAVLGKVTSKTWSRVNDSRIFSNVWNYLGLNKANSVILDVGCGALAGAEIQYSKQGSQVVGIDISRTMVRHADKSSRKYGDIDKAFFVVADAEYLPFKSETFDLVLCIGTISHLPSKKAIMKALVEMREVTVQNGLIYIPTWFNFLSPYGIEHHLELRLLDKLRIPHLNWLMFMGAEEVRRIITKSGLNLRNIRYGQFLELPWLFYPLPDFLTRFAQKVISIVNKFHRTHPILSGLSCVFEATCTKTPQSPFHGRMTFAQCMP